jgi:hypothetical protein
MPEGTLRFSTARRSRPEVAYVIASSVMSFAVCCGIWAIISRLQKTREWASYRSENHAEQGIKWHVHRNLYESSLIRAPGEPAYQLMARDYPAPFRAVVQHRLE